MSSLKICFLSIKTGLFFIFVGRHLEIFVGSNLDLLLNWVFQKKKNKTGYTQFLIWLQYSRKVLFLKIKLIPSNALNRELGVFGKIV